MVEIKVLKTKLKTLDTECNVNIPSFSFTEWVLRNCFTTSNYHFSKEN